MMSDSRIERKRTVWLCRIASQLAIKEMRPRLSGVVVISEDNLLRDLYLLKEQMIFATGHRLRRV